MKHILIVDDEPAIQRIFEEFLQGEGFSTALAADEFEAIQTLLNEASPVD